MIDPRRIQIALLLGIGFLGLGFGISGGLLSMGATALGASDKGNHSGFDTFVIASIIVGLPCTLWGRKLNSRLNQSAAPLGCFISIALFHFGFFIYSIFGIN